MSLEEKGRKMYNSLTEFYERHERMEFLEYMIKYAELEAEFLGIDFEMIVSFRGYIMLEDVYKRNIEHLQSGGEGAVPLEILTEGEIKHELKQKYGGVKK